MSCIVYSNLDGLELISFKCMVGLSTLLDCWVRGALQDRAALPSMSCNAKGCLVSDEEKGAILGLSGGDSEVRLMDIQPL